MVVEKDFGRRFIVEIFNHVDREFMAGLTTNQIVPVFLSFYTDKVDATTYTVVKLWVRSGVSAFISGKPKSACLPINAFGGSEKASLGHFRHAVGQMHRVPGNKLFKLSFFQIILHFLKIFWLFEPSRERVFVVCNSSGNVHL